MQTVRLRCDLFYVDCHLIEREGRWLAFCDEAGDRSVGLGLSRDEALRNALEPFATVADQLLASIDA